MLFRGQPQALQKQDDTAAYESPALAIGFISRNLQWKSGFKYPDGQSSGRFVNTIGAVLLVMCC
jgi:hypothetical protein